MEQNQRMVNPNPKGEDRLDFALRPKKLKDIIGQDQITENLDIPIIYFL